MNQVKPISIDGEGFDIVKNAVIVKPKVFNAD